MNRCEAEIDAIRNKLYEETKHLTREERIRRSNEQGKKLAAQYGFKIGKPYQWVAFKNISKHFAPRLDSPILESQTFSYPRAEFDKMNPESIVKKLNKLTQSDNNFNFFNKFTVF